MAHLTEGTGQPFVAPSWTTLGEVMERAGSERSESAANSYVIIRGKAVDAPNPSSRP